MPPPPLNKPSKLNHLVKAKKVAFKKYNLSFSSASPVATTTQVAVAAALTPGLEAKVDPSSATEEMKSNQNQNRMDEGCKNARGKEKEQLETRDSSGSCHVRVPMEQQRDKLVVRVKLSELASKRAQSSIPQPPAPPPAPPANKNGKLPKCLPCQAPLFD